MNGFTKQFSEPVRALEGRIICICLGLCLMCVPATRCAGRCAVLL
eukprot:COSAG04_NODE_33080_length_178_cov_937.898734_1_plen_44_part_01